MSVDTKILDGSGSQYAATVTQYGALVTSPVEYSKASVNELTANDTGVSFIEPSAGKKIVITSIILYANKNVSATVEADVEVYESTTGSGETVATSILQLGMLKQTTAIIPMNYLSSEGRWIMAKTSDDDVKISIYYYYI